MLHLVSFIVLLYRMKTQKSCRGVSLKTQVLFLITFCCRYLDLFFSFVSVYNTLMKIFFISATATTVYWMVSSCPPTCINLSVICIDSSVTSVTSIRPLHPSIHPSIHPLHPFIHPSTSKRPRMDLYLYPSVCICMYACIYLFIYLSIYLPTYPSNSLSICPSIHPSIYLPIYLPTNI
jgi:hypothetical protein